MGMVSFKLGGWLVGSCAHVKGQGLRMVSGKLWGNLEWRVVRMVICELLGWCVASCGVAESL